MYIPAPMHMTERQQQQDFIDHFSFGLLMSADLEGTHLPFLIERNEGEFGTLYSHAARANPHCRALDGQRVLVAFTGPHAYISPTAYAKTPAVPTWNYAAVHVTGTLELLAPAQTREVITRTLARYEPKLPATNEIVTEEIRDKLSTAIVGLRIRLDNIEGKLKLGQHRSRADQHGVAAALATAGDHQSLQLLDYMQATGIGMGRDNAGSGG